MVLFNLQVPFNFNEWAFCHNLKSNYGLTSTPPTPLSYSNKLVKLNSLSSKENCEADKNKQLRPNFSLSAHVPFPTIHKIF